MHIPYKYVCTDREITEALEQLLNYPLITCDTETTGLDPHTVQILLLQLGNGQMNYVFDCTADNAIARKNIVSPIWKMLRAIFTGRATKIFHNASYDVKIIKAHFDCDVVNIYDTMIAERILTAGKTMKKHSSLAELAVKYNGLTIQEMNKGLSVGFYSGYVITEFSTDEILYAARDIAVLEPIYWAQIPQLVAEGLMDTAELEFAVIPVVASMEYVGVDFDTDKWTQAIAELDTERLQLRREVEAVFKERGLEKQQSLFPEFCTISIDSTSQLLRALKDLGIPLDDSTNKGLLERMTNEYPVLIPLLRYKEHQKLVTAFGAGLIQKINSKTGRLHGGIMQIGADTGRMSMRDPNLQQIPSDQKCALRDCFIAPPGFVVMGADYSQQELRVLAVAANEPNMLLAYAQKEDLHTVTAAFLFKRDIKELKTLLNSLDHKLKAQQFDVITDAEKLAKKQRAIAKSINFLIAYGGSYKRLAYTARVSEEFAKEVMDNHGDAFPRLREFIRTTGEETLRDMYSQTMLGRKRFYTLPNSSDPDYGRIKSAIQRQGTNHKIQGSSADITKAAAVLVHNRFREKFGSDNAYLWGVIHDEIVTMARADLAEEASYILTKSMEDAYYKFIPRDICPIKVDALSGNHWCH